MRLRLYDIRDEHHKLQKELAEYLHCTQPNYSRYEIGEIEPPLSVMEALASYYGTSVDYLMGITDRRTPYPRRPVVGMAFRFAFTLISGASGGGSGTTETSSATSEMI